MQPDEPSGYENEPREHFQPLPLELYARLYHWERQSRELNIELDYYTGLLGCHSPVLELGCGTGVITTALHNGGIDIVGLDLCRHMLLRQNRSIRAPLVQMDMRQLGFHRVFQAACIAHNSLNLLVTKDAICSCLKEIRRVLVPHGRLLLHLFCMPYSRMEEDRQCRLQFYIFEHPEGGKIIKETIRSHIPGDGCLTLEERYKIRRFSDKDQDANYRHRLRLAPFTRKQWLEIISASGFAIDGVQSNFHEPQNTAKPVTDIASSSLLVRARSV